jgi:hypothetical protein
MSLDSSKKTIKAAVAVAAANSVILVAPGTYTEAAITISVANVHIIGLGSLKQIVVSSATDVDTITITSSGCEIANIYFRPPVNTSPSTTFHASIVLNNAPYTNIHDCRFQGQANSVVAIYSATDNGSDNVTIANNVFAYMNTATYGSAINCVETLGFNYSSWKVLGNFFTSCVKNLVLPSRVSLIQGNNFGSAGITSAGAEGAVTTTGCNLSGTNSGANQVHGNYLGGTYSSAGGGYTVGTAGDDWAGNFNIAGITAANPA